MAGDGPFLGGDAPDIADVCLVPQMYNARRFDLPLDAYPKLVARRCRGGGDRRRSPPRIPTASSR